VSEKKSKLLILYSTVDGHAKHICEYAQTKLKKDKDIVIASLDDDSEQKLADFDEILLGASVRYGFHRKNVYEFVRENKEELLKKKTAFFSLNLTARKPEKASPDTNPYIVKFLKKVDWDPDLKSVFAGRLDYPSLNCPNRLAILLIMAITNGPKDLSKVHDFTNWSKVDEMIESIRKL
tara:strand:- start:2746 stop:3282 length:537 start_codon:yes stop_codon:yes gene_type:complete